MVPVTLVLFPGKEEPCSSQEKYGEGIKLWDLEAGVLDSRPKQALHVFWTLISPSMQWR